MMFDQKLIFTGEKFSIKDEVIQYLANKAQEVGKLDSCESYIAAVKKREQEFSTAIGYGVAIPHGSDGAWLQYIVVTVVSTFVVMAVSGWFTQFVIKRGKEAKK